MFNPVINALPPYSYHNFCFCFRNDGQQIYEKVRQSKSPFQEFLSHWKKSETSTIRRLFDYLEEIDRFDVIDDNKEKIEEDIALADSIAREKVLLYLKIFKN